MFIFYVFYFIFCKTLVSDENYHLKKITFQRVFACGPVGLSEHWLPGDLPLIMRLVIRLRMKMRMTMMMIFWGWIQGHWWFLHAGMIILPMRCCHRRHWGKYRHDLYFWWNEETSRKRSADLPNMAGNKQRLKEQKCKTVYSLHYF